MREYIYIYIYTSLIFANLMISLMKNFSLKKKKEEILSFTNFHRA